MHFEFGFPARPLPCWLKNRHQKVLLHFHGSGATAERHRSLSPFFRPVIRLVRAMATMTDDDAVQTVRETVNAWTHSLVDMQQRVTYTHEQQQLRADIEAHARRTNALL